VDLKLGGKCVIVTGGTRNLGREISLGFLDEGANVLATYYQDDTAAKEFVAAVRPEQRNRLTIHKMNVSSASNCAEACSRIVDDFGALNVLVNNAAETRRQDVSEITDADFDAVLRTTLRGTLYMTRAAFVVMKSFGGGRIVNVSSAAPHTGNPNELLYLCAKGGVEAATRAFARLGATAGITANAIAPHVLDSGMGRQTVAADPLIPTRIPLGRLGTIREFVGLVLYSSSTICEYMTGQVIHLNGGRLMR
jgi:NAD(P)-dependent dehydrogenase (short-subunit alcohol dehydrogenase family)